MRSSLLAPALVLVTSFISGSNGLQAISSSPCAAKCGNVLSSTEGIDDIACSDSDFQTSSIAKIFEGCVSCQLASTYIDPVTKQTDLQWALYNLRYAVSWCLFGYPNNTAVAGTPCITSTACGPLANAFEFDSLSANASTFEYCPLLFDHNLPKCSACLASSDGQLFVRNYVTALSAACAQQPIPGNTISLDGTVFSGVPANITVPGSQPSGSASASKHSIFSLGAKVGIAVAAITVGLAILGCCIVWHGKRRRRAILRQRQRESGFVAWTSNPPPGHQPAGMVSSPGGFTPQVRDGGTSAGGFFDSPQSQRPLHHWAALPGRSEDESPASAMGEKVYFSPYSSNYTSPVSASDQVKVQGQEWPLDRKFNPKGFEEGRLQARSRSRDRKQRLTVNDVEDGYGRNIEMQNVPPAPPVLLHPHPGVGRGSSTVAHDDSWRANII